LRVAARGSTQFSDARLYPKPLTDASTVYAVAARSARVITAVDEAFVNDEFTRYAMPHIRATYYRTTDGGLSWRRIGAADLIDPEFASSTTGYALALDLSSYLVTHDGGATWQPQTFGS
jgi:hypothetical protein